ncbi:unnamed protein product [Effrenium voratum]|uniref:Uncharacterized protein n=1 Tax=Effrenium voratum TaxID=2562239 RepID=A0AA36NCS6_9DINO|nr:unnamed protein product [Effrenium voratum]CAJ1421012.1 unnamed protein product [Effrenium voratum]
MGPSMRGPSSLDDLVTCVHYRMLLCMDEGALCTVGCCCRSLQSLATEQALWQRLAMSRDRLAASRFLGSFSPEARSQVTGEDPSPSLPCARFAPGKPREATGTVDWRQICRQLHPGMAERPWEEDSSEECFNSAALWTELTDDSGAYQAPGPEHQIPNAAVLASQSPHLFWIGGDRLLGIAGGYSPDVVGGAALHPLRELYVLDLPNISVHGDGITHPDLSVRKLDCGIAGGMLPHGHPSMNGAACDFDPVRRTVYFFGGGAPHSDVNNATSALRLEHWDGDQPVAEWQVVSSPGSVESGQIPSPRQGLKGTVFRDEFVVFGGRLPGGRCTNEVWSLDLAEDQGGCGSTATSLPWRRLECDGQAPSARVWHCACQAVHGQWFIYGGSTWQFEEPSGPHDFRTLFILDLAERRWSCVESSGPVRPPWSVAGSLVPLGCCQLLLLGGTLPHKLGAGGLNAHSLRQWRTWYNRLDEPWVFDLGTQQWLPREAAVALPGDSDQLEEYVAEVYLRSHLAACFLPQRRSVVVFGGSRYFTGEYFNDILELQLPGQRTGRGVLGEGRRQDSRHRLLGPFQAPNGLPHHLQVADGREATVTRGFLGRLRGMLQEGIINQEQFNSMRMLG